MTAMTNPAANEAPRTLGDEYQRSLRLVERLHRQLLDVIKDELDRQGRTDVNSVQALLLYNIGDEELTAGELRTRGHYLGSNVSYNLKKLVEAGYIRHQRSDSDRRSVRVRLTPEGQSVRDLLDGLFSRQLAALEPVARLDADVLGKINDALVRLERFWEDHIRYRL
jgi:DNA-binding MarR family transcriptional regulator